jgi:hypothetical protein
MAGRGLRTFSTESLTLAKTAGFIIRNKVKKRLRDANFVAILACATVLTA